MTLLFSLFRFFVFMALATRYQSAVSIGASDYKQIRLKTYGRFLSFLRL